MQLARRLPWENVLRLLFLLFLLPLAAAGDPLAAPACRAALEALSTAEAGSDRTALQAARQRAARECLATQADPPRPQRTPLPPVAVPSAVIPPPPLRAAEPMPPAPAARRPMPPPTVTTCDAISCLTSDGQRLPRSGPDLIGPRGACSVQAGVVVCP